MYKRGENRTRIFDECFYFRVIVEDKSILSMLKKEVPSDRSADQISHVLARETQRATEENALPNQGINGKLKGPD